MRGNTVHMNMNSDGARAWARITRQNVEARGHRARQPGYLHPTVNNVIDGGPERNHRRLHHGRSSGPCKRPQIRRKMTAKV